MLARLGFGVATSDALGQGEGQRWMHSLALNWRLVHTEIKMRARRLSSLIAFLLTVVLMWQMIVDPKSGNSLLVVEHARVAYTSAALAMGSVTLLSLLMAFVGFYLVRGRSTQDLQLGLGYVIAATPVTARALLWGRLCGGVLYLGLLVLGAMFSVMLLQLVRGEGAIHVSDYLSTYALIALPSIVGAVSFAILFDSIPFLMGRKGDVLYFFIWVFQASLGAMIAESMHGRIGFPLLLVFDSSGLIVNMMNLSVHLHSAVTSNGVTHYDPNLPVVVVTTMSWGAKAISLRLMTAGLNLLPWLLASFLFHRYSPDRLKNATAALGLSFVGRINRRLRFLTVTLQPMLRWAARHPGALSRVVAEVALSLIATPIAIIGIPLALLFSAILPTQALPSFAAATLALWGIMICEISARDARSGIAGMNAIARGGMRDRIVRQGAASIFLGFMMTSVILVRWCFAMPLVVCTLILGVICLAMLASALGSLTNTSRAFLAIFLFWLYIATQATDLPVLDLLGFNLSANLRTLTLQIAILVCSGLALSWHVHRKERT